MYKRFFDLDDLDRQSVTTIRAAAAHPAGFPVPAVDDGGDQLADDWEEAERAAIGYREASSGGRGRVAPAGAPVVPKFVRDFIGFGDVQEPGGAVTLFRCAAALAEAGTPPAVIRGLLEEVALKSGLESAEVDRQLAAGIERGKSRGTGVTA